MAVMVSLASCDPVSSVEFKIYNKTTDTVTIVMYKEIMTSPYEGYTIIENDSVSTDYEADSCNVAVLAPEQVLQVLPVSAVPEPEPVQVSVLPLPS